MNSSVAMNVLYVYFDFDVKKDKLKWSGSFDDLKAFVLTVIDEETAETTTWRSPSGNLQVGHVGGEAQKSILLLLLWAPTDVGEKHCQVCPNRLVAGQELVVTRLAKSKNTYLEEEKSIALEEQVKDHIESK